MKGEKKRKEERKKEREKEKEKERETFSRGEARKCVASVIK